MIGESVRIEIEEAIAYLKTLPADIERMHLETKSLAGVDIEIVINREDTLEIILGRWGYQPADSLDPSPQDLYIYTPPETADPQDYNTFDRMPREMKEAVWYTPGGPPGLKKAWSEIVLTKPSPDVLRRHIAQKEFDASVRPHRVHRRERTDVLQGLVQGLVRRSPLRRPGRR